MISYLKGKVILKGEDYIILDVGGIGFKIFLAKESLQKASQDKTLEVFTFLSLKRTTIELYGLLSQEARELFETLEEISGIGPKTALVLASFGSLEKLKEAIEKRNEEFSERVKGIGQKKIQRMILELTGKLKDMEKKQVIPADEAFDALLSLGFSQKEANLALSKIPKDTKDLKEKVAQALRVLGKK